MTQNVLVMWSCFFELEQVKQDKGALVEVLGIETYEVCKECLSIGISDHSCICTYQKKFETIKLEFNKCKVCNSVSEDYADTEFNRQALSNS